MDTCCELLEGSETTLDLLETPWTSQNFPEVPRKFLGDFPGASLTVDFKGLFPEVPRSFPRLPQKFPGLPRKFPGPP